MNYWLLSVPIVFILFLVLLTASYFILSKYSAKGFDHKEKYLPYTGGQQLPPRVIRLSYQTFFRLGLLFGIMHVAALIVSTLPLNWVEHRIGLIYLVGIAISAFVLARTTSE
jgi:NADH:ubiquinone oxidoreductase subunit 3 (subunit A)